MKQNGFCFHYFSKTQRNLQRSSRKLLITASIQQLFDLWMSRNERVRLLSIKFFRCLWVEKEHLSLDSSLFQSSAGFVRALYFPLPQPFSLQSHVLTNFFFSFDIDWRITGGGCLRRGEKPVLFFIVLIKVSKRWLWCENNFFNAFFNHLFIIYYYLTGCFLILLDF